MGGMWSRPCPSDGGALCYLKEACMADCSDELKISSERDYLRSVVEQIHVDTHDALTETGVSSLPSLEERANKWLEQANSGEGAIQGNVERPFNYVRPARALGEGNDIASRPLGVNPYTDPVNPVHYAALDPQPWDIVNAWGLDYFEGSVLKYLSRWRRKNGLQDLYKARQFLDKLIAIEEAK